MSSSARTFPAAIDHAAQSFSAREALVDTAVEGTLRWDFAGFAAQIRRHAAAVIAAGVRPGDRVSVWAPNGHRFAAAALGAVYAGAVLVPINTRYKGEEAHWILAKSGARLLFVQNGFLGNDYLAMLRDGRPGTREQPVAGLPALTEVIELQDDAGPQETALSDFLARGASVPPEQVQARADAVRPDDVSDMFFTSGTTGRPKGALTTHGQNIRVYHAWADGVGLREGDRYLLVNPMFHTFGYKAGVLACLLKGATLIPQPTFDVGAALRIMHDERVSIMPGPPTLYASILDHPRRSEFDLSALRIGVTGAAIVPVALIERMRAQLCPSVVIAYGMTETCGTATVGDPNDDAETIATTVGRAIEGTELRIVDANGTPLPPGQSGEVQVRGYNVMQGYFDDPEATAATIEPDGWLHTGDVGELRPDGNLRITDRLKDMFVVGGFNAYPAEIEQTITRHDKVSEAAVIGVPDERLGEVGRAYVIARPGETITEDEIIAYCRQHLANFKVPRSVVVVDQFPRNASGKVLKFALRADATQRPAVSS
jgi:acyl-CoA synthetase (AMP-forming)/AMP-acid ligase II